MHIIKIQCTSRSSKDVRLNMFDTDLIPLSECQVWVRKTRLLSNWTCSTQIPRSGDASGGAWHGAEHPIRPLILTIDGSDLCQAIDGSDLYALRFNLSRLCRDERLDATRHLAWQGVLGSIPCPRSHTLIQCQESKMGTLSSVESPTWVLHTFCRIHVTKRITPIN